MAISYLGSDAFAGHTAPSSSGSHDTTGATLIVVGTQHWNTNPGAPTDNKGNTYTALTHRGSAFAQQTIYYCVNPTVGAGHVFTQPSAGSSSNVSASVAWFGGTLTSGAFDVEAGASALTASITPSQNNSLIICVGAEYYSSTNPYTINAGFTAVQTFISTNIDIPACMAYLIQGTAAAVTPTWSKVGGSISEVICLAVFKGAAGGGGGGGGEIAAMCSRYGLNARNGYGLRR